MRVAVLSDVHGFSLNLQAVLNDIDQLGPWDRIVVAGDLAEEGPAPAESLDLIQARGLEAVMGNTDYNVISNAQEHPVRAWTRSQLGSQRLEWLAALPFEVRISPPDAVSPRHDLLVVHANPQDWNRAMHPEASPQEIADLVGDTKAAAIAFGHIHISYIRDVNGFLLVDVSSAGNPKDGDIRSRWGSLEWNGHAWAAQIHHVDVDTEAVVEQFRESGRPSADKAIAKYLKASYAD
jgi:predicted phosphodiesterase